MSTSLILFNGEDKNGSRGLWVSNGTAAGTSELSIDGAYVDGIDPTYLTALGNVMLFNGSSGDFIPDAGLWVTNGTAAGTSELISIGPKSLIAFGTEVLFTDNAGALYVSDGTSAGTSEISVAGAYPTGLSPSDFTVFGSEVLFEGRDASNNYRLWVTKGTAATTSELPITVPDPFDLKTFGSKVLFSSNGNLWITDGTAGGTSELATYLYPFDITVLGNKALFNSSVNNSSQFTTEINDDLWITDGTAAGTKKIAVANAYSTGVNPTDMTTFGSLVLFNGEDASGHAGLWVTDGTSAGTSELSIAGAPSYGIDPSSFAVYGNEVYFQGQDANGLINLWMTNGTSAGTSEVFGIAGAAMSSNVGVDPVALITLGSKMLFGASSGGLWVTNGTAVGTSLVSSVATPFGYDSVTPNPVVFNGKVMFGAKDPNEYFADWAIWVSDGTTAGTSELSTITGAYGGGKDINATDFTVFGTKVLFAGWDANLHGNLWVTDGTQGGTSELTVAGASASGLIAIDGNSLLASDMVAFSGKILFEGQDASGYGGLWVTNGTAAGTSELSIAGTYAGGFFYGPTNPANHYFSPDLTVFGTKVLFTGIDAAGNYGLWVTTGTAAGTSELSIAGAYASGYAIDPTNMVVFGSEVLFNGTDATGAYEMWVTNGTAAGTSELAVAGADASNGLDPTNITVFGTKVLFNGRDANGSRGLWISDGTAAGTSELMVSGAYLISSYYNGYAGLDPTNFTVLGSKAFFNGKDADDVRHLWVTDGTAAGTSEFFPQLYSTLDPTELAVLLSNVTTVGSGQTVTVVSGQTDTSDVIQSGGTENVLSGGKTNSATVAKGGTLNIASGGTANSAIISGGTVYVSGTSSSATISAGGEQDVLAGGTIASTTILAGGSSVIFAGGTGDPTTIDAGGTETINSGGSDTGVIVNGGALLVYGSAPNAAVSGGGGIIVEKGGTASGATLSSSGTIVVYSGGTASGGTVTNGGTVIVSSGATVSGMTIGSGGTLLITSGATVSSITIGNGGTVEYFGTSPAGVTVQSGGKAVQLDAASSSALTYIYQSGLNYYVNSANLASPINFASTTGSNLLGNLSVSTNSDGSFNVFWTSGSASGGNATYSAFENSYSASGTLNSSTTRFNNGVAVGGAAAGALTDYFNGATNGSSGSSAFYAFENNGTFYVVGHGTSQIQFATGTNIGNISISANSDNSFQVFWTTSTTNGSTTTYTATENSYAANGTLTGTRQIGSQNSFTASGYPVTGNYFAGDGSGSGGYVYAYQNGTTYYVATNTVTTPIQFTSGSTIGNVSASLNSDGTFAVFWTSFSTSNPANYTAFKNIYSAAGTLTSSTQIGSYSESTLAYTDYFAASTAVTSRPLFTTGVDSVNFNALSAAQLQQASNNPQSMYADFGGNGDVTTLPSASEMQTLGWSPGAFFYDGSLGGQSYKVAGSNADNDIALGAGNDTVYGSPGSDLIVGGSGQDTFDFQHGAFANFSGFAPTTTQTIVGGHASFVPLTSSTLQNVILLPGSPNDYTISVSFPGGDAFSTTRTAITTTGAGGLEPGVTLDTTGVEKVQFASFVNLPNVTLTGGSLASEALKLADEVYGYSVDTRDSHLKDPLADEPQENQNSSSFNVNAVLVSYDSAAAAESRGWYPLQAIDLGMAPADYLQQSGGLRYSFVNGYYQAYATGDVWPLSSDFAEADALVLAGNVNGTKTLAISFSGTDQKADMGDYPNFAVYYAKYQPLIDALMKYVADNGIGQILVSGHSLGAGALQYFMKDFGAGAGSPSIPVYAYTAGSPGSEADTSDTRVVNFVHTNDLVPFAGTLSPLATVLTGIGALLLPGLPLFHSKSRAGETVLIDSDVADGPSVDEHKLALYEQDALKLESFATDNNSPFKTIAAAIESSSSEDTLRDLLKNLGGTVEVAVGKPLVFDADTGVVGGPYNAAGLASYNSDVRAYSDDQYVLGNENSTGTDFVVSALNLVAASQRIFDGASGKSRVELPFAASDFQYSQKTSDGQGYQLYSLIDPDTLAMDAHDLVGSLYRVQQLIFPHAHTGPYAVNLDGSPISVQSPVFNQTAMTVISSYDYADTGGNNLTVTGSGNGDIIAVGAGNVTINESAGNSIVFVKDAHSTGSFTAHFASGDNTVVLGAGAANVTVGSGDDDIFAGSGNATIDGGGGTNTAEFSDLTTPGIVAIIQGGKGTVNAGSGNGIEQLKNIQEIVDSGTGRSNGDVFYVDANETVAGGSNFNYLIELTAGVTLTYGISFTGITEFVSNVGTNIVDFSADPHFAYLYGSTGNDTLSLGTGGGYLFGEGGTNILSGGANATNLFEGGSGGTDTMNGGSGTAGNFYYVDGSDTINGAGAFNAMIELVAGVTVQLGSAQYQHVQEFVSNGGTNTVTVANTDTDYVYLYGGAGNDTLTTGSGGGYLIGEGGTNVLTGGGGQNVFLADGASGIDTMNGGSGSNVYYIDSHSTVHGAGTFNTVIELQQNVSLALGNAQLGSNVQEVVLNGGTNSVDFHTATSAVYLYGAAGADTLFGGTGSDYLYGGAGTNTFKFGTNWGKDLIGDWITGSNNVIDLTALSGLGVHAITDLTQTIVGGNDVITSSHTGTNSITLRNVGSALTASSFHFN